MIDALKGINGGMWAFTAVIIGMVFVQAFLFFGLARKFNVKHALVTKEEAKMAARTGVVTCFGATMISASTLALIAMVGSAITFMRCGVIGAPGWELMMAQVASSAVHVDFGTPEFTTEILILCLFCMVLGSAPYFINCIIMLKPLDMMVEKEKKAEKKLSFMPYMGKAAMMGLIGCLAMDNMWGNAAKEVGFVCAVLGGLAVSQMAKKLKNSLLSSMVMPTGMIVAMVAGQLFATYFM